jgi:hypothetical protein
MEVFNSKNNGLKLLKVLGPWKDLNASMKKSKNRFYILAHTENSP